jgi:putative acyl-CoA dehydrogenase
MAPTHDVLNQPPPLEGYDCYAADRVLREAVQREGAGWAEPQLATLGRIAGDAATLRLGAEAEANPPRLETHDRYGNRIDEVSYHPAYHALLGLAVEHETHALPWRDPKPGAHVARAALMTLLYQVEQGIFCPISMTYGAIPSLRKLPDVAQEWEPRILSSQYDRRLVPAPGKTGVLVGMAMTEKQGGSDVRANTTRARPLAARGPGNEYELTGHKWFCSAPMCDAFLMLAQAEGGLSCFFVPRFRPDGTRNALALMRLKPKLGNRANASSELELLGAWGRLIADEGRGVATILEMAHHTRLDCVIGSAALMRQAVAQATHHCAHRMAFGKRLADQPLMQSVLADLAIESEAATITMARLARSFDERERGERERVFGRVATALAKYWICKRAPGHVGEALECLGGNGYVEESGMPRLYREAPLNSIWEGSGNVICLDVLRALDREPAALFVLLEEINAAKGADARLDDFVRALREDMGALADPGPSARRLAERLALALMGSLVVRYADPAVADAFCAARLSPERALAYGAFPGRVDAARILLRHTPVVP